MLKHCPSNSVRLQRRYNSPQADSVSLTSSVTIRSNGDSSDSSLNSSFSMQHANTVYTMKQNIYEESLYGGRSCRGAGSTGYRTPDPMSLSSRTSSYSSLVADSGPRTAIKVYASCLRSDIDYKTLSVVSSTTAREIIWQLLSKFRMKHRDPKLFFLTMEVVIQKPGRDGLTKKTIVLEEDSRPVELKNCNPWGECKFTLQTRKGGLVKIHDSILMEESQYKCLLISEDTTVQEVIKLLLYCNGLEKVERPERYCMYEQCNSQRYQRKLLNDDRPLNIQALWPGAAPFSFVLRRSLVRVEDNVWIKPRTIRVIPNETVEFTSQQNSRAANSMPSPWGLSDEKSFYLSSTGPNLSQPKAMKQNKMDQVMPKLQQPEQVVPRIQTPESEYSGQMSESPTPPHRNVGCGPRFHLVRNLEDDVTWPEVDKDDSEEHVSSSGEDMDTSLSSNESPIPPLTSTPMGASDIVLRKKLFRPMPIDLPSASKPKMSFLYPSPDYETFPIKAVPSRPYSALSSESIVPTDSKNSTLAPSLPPKPPSLISVDRKSTSSTPPSHQQMNNFHDYENYFYI